MLVESRYPNCLSFSLLLQDGAHFFFSICYFILQYELGQTLGDGEGGRDLASSSPWVHRVRHHWVTEQQQ